ncbi:MAG: class I SAM-dependent methyltransferase [Candidatus Competibacteraceae bacterium]|nr:class I SAM-dependent methyltransferase [Candidatus Competibacteraceae bacterium]
MTGFATDWLDLREPLDAVSRDPEIIETLIEWSRPHAALSVLDLGCGTGTNFRFLAPLLNEEQHWRLVDLDPDALACGEQRLRQWAAERTLSVRADAMALALESAERRYRLEPLRLDLAGDWEPLERSAAALVTASALLDLTSAVWLDRLARQCRAWRAAVYIALSYDGYIRWEPMLDRDDQVRERINRHQRTDKGFGPALGPDAPATLAIRLRELGYGVMLQPSPWRLGAEHDAMQTALLSGWSRVVRQLDPMATDWLSGWTAERQRLIDDRVSRLDVGHWDLLARLP